MWRNLPRAQAAALRKREYTLLMVSPGLAGGSELEELKCLETGAESLQL